MRNLFIFISRYSAFFLFLIFEVSSLVILVKYNSFQKASFINSSSELTGTIYERVDEITRYLNLGQTNTRLAEENARLRSQLKSSFYNTKIADSTVSDTSYKQQYTYIEAQVINNSISRSNNYLTLNRGSDQGIAKGMGVICPTGVVGKVVNVTKHFSTVQSLLHKDFRVSGLLVTSNAFGSVKWGDDLNPYSAILSDVPNIAKPKVGEQVVTSEYSLFPMGISIGKISKIGVKGGTNFINFEILLSTDFARLQQVYVVKNKLQQEQQTLESQQKKDDE